MQNQDIQEEVVQFTFPEKTERVEYKHVFDDKELINLGAELNTQRKDKNQMELDKKSAMSTWKSRIEAKEAEMNITGNYLNDGYKFEQVEAIKKINGNTLEFEYYHPENSDLIETRKMSQKEIREFFPRRKNMEKKIFEYYNPLTNIVVDTRPTSAEELQLTLEDEKAANELERTAEDAGVPSELDDIFGDEADFDGGELKPKRKKK